MWMSEKKKLFFLTHSFALSTMEERYGKFMENFWPFRCRLGYKLCDVNKAASVRVGRNVSEKFKMGTIRIF